MAGQKLTDPERVQVLDLIKQGYKIEEIQGRFPHVDGRSISGMVMRHTSHVGAPEAPLSSTFPAPPPLTTSAPAPVPGDTGLKTPQIQSGEDIGFTPSSQVPLTGGGFKPSHREYFVIKKLDPPGDGILRNEYPPFGIQELMDRYAPGDYEIQHYREGRLFTTYRERIAPRGSSASTPISREPAGGPQTPADNFVRAMDVYHKIHAEGRQEAAQVRAVEAQAKTEEVKAKARVEETATVGLLNLVSKLGEPKPTGNEGSVERIFGLMQEDRKTLGEKLQNEVTLMRERHKLDLEIERERVKSETQRAREDANAHLERERLFMSKIAELDKDRQELWKESYQNMITETKGMQDAFSRELEDKKKWLDQYTDLQRKHTDEIVSLKKEIGGGGSTKMMEVVKDGIVQSIDRIGARVDMMVREGVIQGPLRNPGDQKPIGAGAVAPAGQNGGTRAVLTKDAIAEALKEPWFQDLQDEIVRTVKKRKTVTDARLKPHGTLLGQAFIDKMNEDVSMRRYLHYLCSREWKEVLADAESGIKPENKELMHDPEADTWFVEFSDFLTLSWNNSIGVSK